MISAIFARRLEGLVEKYFDGTHIFEKENKREGKVICDVIIIIEYCSYPGCSTYCSLDLLQEPVRRFPGWQGTRRQAVR